MNRITNGFIIQRTGIEDYHSLNDFGLAISNTNYIAEPQLEEHYIDVPYGQRIDISEYLTGFPVFKNRIISLELGSTKRPSDWDAFISDFRNKYDGRIVRVIFDNDQDWYWTGRARILNFDRVQAIGTFTLQIDAEPTKYHIRPITENITSKRIVTFESEFPAIPTVNCGGIKGTAPEVILEQYETEIYRQKLHTGVNVIAGYNTSMKNVDFIVDPKSTSVTVSVNRRSL